MRISPISFGKIYRSEVKVKNAQTGEYETMNFVEYENKDEDNAQLSKYERECEQENLYDFTDEADYSGEIMSDFLYCSGGEKKHKIGKNFYFYGIEDKDENIQCLCEVEKDDYNCFICPLDEIPNKRKPLYIAYIGVRPTNFYGRDDRGYSRLGSNMVKEVIKTAKKKRNGYVWLRSTNDKFWDKIPYTQRGFLFSDVMFVNKKDYAKCIDELDLMI